MKIFAHRGYVINDSAQNSIKSLNAAVENNFFGVEYDVWFKGGKLVVAHDDPSDSDLNILPKFRDYFVQGNKIKYWIDFKNMNESNATEILRIVKQDVDFCKISARNIYFAPYIERLSEAALVYDKIREIFGREAQIMAFCIKIPSERLQRYYQDLKKNDIKFLSIMHENIDENFIRIFRDIEIFAWTINDFERMKEIAMLGVSNCTSDKITPRDYDARK
ncbi:MAG TPA: glycerophosphodiester phosphodiesterase [Rickettsiales bacterium]|nr:glycerophosphodiester phosphodiesterase [Rickettsiales bacterium]